MNHNKQCPFCGSNNLSIEFFIPAWGSEGKEIHIVCDECASSAPAYIWNHRAKPHTKNNAP